MPYNYQQQHHEQQQQQHGASSSDAAAVVQSVDQSRVSFAPSGSELLIDLSWSRAANNVSRTDTRRRPSAAVQPHRPAPPVGL